MAAAVFETPAAELARLRAHVAEFGAQVAADRAIIASMGRAMAALVEELKTINLDRASWPAANSMQDHRQ